MGMQIRRLRLAFGALALLVALPLGVLVRRAIDSERREEERAHRAVAERILDEMERELNEFLSREEERSFEEYRSVVLPSQALTDVLALEPSPLAAPPVESFVLAYFQIEPDGVVTTPQSFDVPEEKESADRLLQAVRAHWEGRSITSSPAAVSRTDASPELERRDDEKESETALGELNRAADDRRDRRAKLSQAPAVNVYSFASEEEDNVLRKRHASTEAASASELSEAVQQRLQKATTEPVDVRLEPMVGTAIDGDRMLLYRTVVIDRAGYRQGMVLDVPALIQWLDERVVSASALDRRARLAGAIERPAGEVAPRYTVPHRFAEPFSPVSAVVELEPFPELSGSSYAAILSALLLVTAALGLFAIYRMAAVAVAFADRRQNFVSAVSHELKTPLTAIRMYGEMLRDDLVASPTKRQRYYEVITAETERLSRLVDNVLELGRIERNERSLRFVTGRLEPVLKEAVAAIGPHAENEGFHIVLDLDDDLPPVRFDPDALSQILFNLLDNAVKYAKSDTGQRIALTARKSETGVAVEVADEGPGVDPAQLGRIFEPFYRAQSELTRTAKGTGIGLALVKDLVEQMGGTVEAANREGGGFAIRLLLRARDTH